MWRANAIIMNFTVACLSLPVQNHGHCAIEYNKYSANNVICLLSIIVQNHHTSMPHLCLVWWIFIHAIAQHYKDYI